MTNRRRGLMDQAVVTLAAQRLGVTARNKGFNAARKVMCEGASVPSVIRLHQTNRQNVHAAIKRIEDAYKLIGICPYCGNKMREV
jgi:hypothetical protein